jgi:multiple sugar transport system permease protein
MLWVFFLIILGLTLLFLRSSQSWVYYEVDTEAEQEGAAR